MGLGLCAMYRVASNLVNAQEHVHSFSSVVLCCRNHVCATVSPQHQTNGGRDAAVGAVLRQADEEPSWAERLQGILKD